MPKLELKEMFIWEQSSHHSPKQNGIVLAHVRRLKLSSGKSIWGSAATHASTQSIMQDVSAYPSCRVFSSSWQSGLDIKRRGRHPLGSEMSLAQGTCQAWRESEGGSCSCLVQLLQEEPQRWQEQILCCGGSRHYGSGHGLPHGRLNMRKNDVPSRVMLQENTCLNRCTDLCLMFMMWLNEATMWPAVVVVAVLLMGGQTGDHQGPDTILRILWAWASSLLYAT